MALACVGHGLHEWRRKPLPCVDHNGLECSRDRYTPPGKLDDVEPENERPFFLRSSWLIVTKRNHCPPPFGDLRPGVFFPAPWELSGLFLKIFALGLCSSSFLRLARSSLCLASAPIERSASACFCFNSCSRTSIRALSSTRA